MSDLIKCSHCNRIHDKYIDCEDKLKHKRQHKKVYNDIYDTCYNTSEWKRIREEVLKENNYMCEICFQLNKINCVDLQIHHIIKIIEDRSKMFDKNNLLCLCREHHRIVENMSLDEIKTYVNSLK